MSVLILDKEYEEYMQQKEEIERLNNIIKEAREYIENHIRIDDEYPDYMEMLLEEYNELLEILDKGEQNDTNI